MSPSLLGMSLLSVTWYKGMSGYLNPRSPYHKKLSTKHLQIAPTNINLYVYIYIQLPGTFYTHINIYVAYKNKCLFLSFLTIRLVEIKWSVRHNYSDNVLTNPIVFSYVLWKEIKDILNEGSWLFFFINILIKHKLILFLLMTTLFGRKVIFNSF